jgi:hypothetical protein
VVDIGSSIPEGSLREHIWRHAGDAGGSGGDGEANEGGGRYGSLVPPGEAIDDIARHWKMAHDLLLGDIHYLRSNWIIYYEDLCGHLDEELQKVSEFLEFEPALTRKMLPSLIPTARNVYDAYLPIQNLNEESRGWLTAEEMHTIKCIAGKTISRVGYAAEPADGADPVDRLKGG